MKIIPTSAQSDPIRALPLGKSVVRASVNQKGGVGKTSLSLNLGFELSKTGFKTLLIDLDPQASLPKNLIGEDYSLRLRSHRYPAVSWDPNAQ